MKPAGRSLTSCTSSVRSNCCGFISKRPVVMRDADSVNKLSLDRYDIIRAQQKDGLPSSSFLLPVGDPPVLPPQRAPGAATAPTTPPPLSPPAPGPAASTPAGSTN